MMRTEHRKLKNANAKAVHELQFARTDDQYVKLHKAAELAKNALNKFELNLYK